MKMLRSNNSYKNCWIKMAGKYDQLHIMTKHPTKYESYYIKKLIEVAITKWSGADERRQTEKLYAAHKIGKACQRAHWCIFLKILTILPGVACGPFPTFNSSLTTPPAITSFLGCFCCCFGDSVEFVWK